MDPLLVNVQAAVGKMNLATQRKAQAASIETDLTTAEQEIASTAVDDLLQANRNRIVQAAAGQMAGMEDQQVAGTDQFPAGTRTIAEEPAPGLESLMGANVVEQLRAARQRDEEAQSAASRPVPPPAPNPPAAPAVDVEAERIADELDKLEDEDVLPATLSLPEEMAARVGKVVRERTNKGIREMNAKREARAGTPEANPFRPNITAPPRTQPAAPATASPPAPQPPKPGPVAPPEPVVAAPPPPPQPAPEAKAKGRKKVGSEGFLKKNLEATIDDYISDVDNLTPEEIAQVDADRGVQRTGSTVAPVETNKTRYIKFRDQLEGVIRSHSRIALLRGDAPAEGRVESAVLKDAQRSFAKAQKEGKEWALNFAIRSAKSVISREILNITKTETWKEKVQTLSLTQQGESGETQRNIPVNTQEEEEADPELDQVEDPRATRIEASIKDKRLRIGEALQNFIQDEELEDEQHPREPACPSARAERKPPEPAAGAHHPERRRQTRAQHGVEHRGVV
jgi:hypothetical protein